MTGYDDFLLILPVSSILPLIMMCYGFMTILFCVYDMTIQDEMMFPKYLYPYSVDTYLDISVYNYKSYYLLVVFTKYTYQIIKSYHLAFNVCIKSSRKTRHQKVIVNINLFLYISLISSTSQFN